MDPPPLLLNSVCLDGNFGVLGLSVNLNENMQAGQIAQDSSEFAAHGTIINRGTWRIGRTSLSSALHGMHPLAHRWTISG